MKLLIPKGQTSKLVQIFIQDSSVATGAGRTGLAFNTAGLTCYYRRNGGSVTAITLATMTLGTWVSGGFVQVDATNMPGLYEFGIPNAVLASGADDVVIMFKGASNMVPVPVEIQLASFNPNDAVRLGLTALPNANAAANGGLPTGDGNNAVKVQSGTGANQLDLTSGAINITQTGADKVWGTAARTLTAFGFSVTVGVNGDKTGYALTSGERDSIATALFKFDISTITGEASRSLIRAIRPLVNKVVVAAGLMTIYKEDDTTISHTMNVTENASANPITSQDPN